MVVQHLTGAYRSRPRPSSTPGAKASTVCPYYLDGDPDRAERPVGDTRIDLASCAVFKVRREGAKPRRPLHPNRSCRRGRSLKTQQRVCVHASGRGAIARAGACRPGSVDMLGRRSASRGGPAGSRRSAARPRRPSARELPRKEVIQPHLPVRLPCYDFTPITGPTFDGSLP